MWREANWSRRVCDCYNTDNLGCTYFMFILRNRWFTASIALPFRVFHTWSAPFGHFHHSLPRYVKGRDLGSRSPFFSLSQYRKMSGTTEASDFSGWATTSMAAVLYPFSIPHDPEDCLFGTLQIAWPRQNMSCTYNEQVAQMRSFFCISLHCFIFLQRNAVESIPFPPTRCLPSGRELW